MSGPGTTPAGLTRREAIGRGAAAGMALYLGPPRTAAAAVSGTRATRPLVFGAELEYYRSDPQHLETRLDLCLHAGYRTIQTYVPWHVHENIRGLLDFSGSTHPVLVHDHLDEYQIETPDQEAAAGGLPGRVVANTDLLGLIAACARRRLDLVLRPGPFISDEWHNGGLPDWLLNAYPNMFQRGPGGTALEPGIPFSPPVETVPGGGPLYYFAGPSYASPEYRAEAFRWLRSFAAVIRPHLRSHGGPVTLLQVDDEICFYYRFGPFEVDYHPVMLARFGTSAPTDWPATGQPPTALRPALRWQRFKARQLAAWLADTRALRAGGADVPVFHEQELQLCPPANLAQLSAAIDVLHPEFYLDPGAWSQPTIELCAAAVRAAQRGRRDLFADEMSAGYVFVRHLLLGEGIKGFLGFSYTQGIPDDVVDDMAVLGRTLRLAGERITASDRVADTAIVWPPEHLYTPYGADSYGFQHDIRNVIEREHLRAGHAAHPRRPGLRSAGHRRRAARGPGALPQRVAGVWGRAGALDAVLPDPLRPPGRTADLLAGAAHAGRGLRAVHHPARLAVRSGAGPLLRHRRPDRHRHWPAGGSLARRTDLPAVARRAGDRRPRDGALRLPPPARARPGLPAGHLARGRLCGRPLGDVLEIQEDPSSGVGPPQKAIVFDYTNQRRGGEVIAGGIVARWHGENVHPTTNQVNTASGNVVTLPPLPDRPIGAAHLRLARALHGPPPICEVSDHHIQGRLLMARQGGAGTVSLLDRYDIDVSFHARVAMDGQVVRLPLRGEMKLPAQSAILLPVEYLLAPGVSVEQATVQLLDATLSATTLELDVTSPAGGELLLGLPGRVQAVRIGSRAAGFSQRRDLVFIPVPAGQQAVRLSWRRRTGRHGR